jgi:hypothetical protein
LTRQLVAVLRAAASAANRPLPERALSKAEIEVELDLSSRAGGAIAGASASDFAHAPHSS